MKFLVDENVGLRIISPLRLLGFDIKSIIEVSRGATDTQVLSLANKEGRILITSDKDFGELIYSEKIIHRGVILLRLRDQSSKNKIRVLQALLQTRLGEMEGAFTVVTDSTIRISKF